MHMVSSLLGEGPGSVGKIISAGLDPAQMGDSIEGQVLSWVMNFSKQYHEMPSPVLLTQSFESYFTDQPLPAPTAPVQFWLDKMREIRAKDYFKECLEELLRCEESKDLASGIRIMQEATKELRRLQQGVQKVVSLPAKAKEVIEFHDKIAAGWRGVETPWPTMNEMTYGFKEEDFVLFVARLGVGKTWILIVLADYIWRSGKRVLIASTEMGQLRMALRWFANNQRLPPDVFRKGRLKAARDKIAKRAEEIASMEGLYMVGGGNFKTGFDSIEAAADEVEPDIILIDGAYLLTKENSGKGQKRSEWDRYKQAAEVFEEVKQMQLRLAKPVVATTQFNRTAKRNSLAGAEVENIAMSDTAGQASDWIFAQMQTDEMKDSLEMIIKPLKTREGSGKEFMIRWDIDNGNFEEIEHTRRNAADAPTVNIAADIGIAGGRPSPVDTKDPLKAMDKPSKKDPLINFVSDLGLPPIDEPTTLSAPEPPSRVPGEDDRDGEEEEDPFAQVLAPKDNKDGEGDW